MKAQILRALNRRKTLPGAGTTAYRLLNGAGDDTPDITADLFDQVVVLSLYRTLDRAEEDAWVDGLAEALRPRAIYLKRRPKEARVEAQRSKQTVSPAAPALGLAVDRLLAEENALRFVIRPAQGLSVGLYLDMRDTRAWVRSAAAGRTVLNLFSYTCGFAVAALAGGARSVTNVDLSRRVLDWGAENLVANDLSADRAARVAADAQGFLARAARRGERFDMVILDPPSFATGPHGAFSVARDYPGLARQAAEVVSPGGILLACCNLASLSMEGFRTKVEAGVAAAERAARRVHELGASPIDFPGAKGERAGLKVLVYGLA